MLKNGRFLSTRLARLFREQLLIPSVKQSTFKSNVSVEALYPSSNPDILRPTPTAGSTTSSIPIPVQVQNQDSNDRQETFGGHVPVDELEITKSRSSGPGGQHANKVNSKVEIRFHLKTASWIPDWIKPRLAEQERSRLTKDGMFVVKSDMTRKAMLNQADCLNKLRSMIHKSSVLPSPPTEEEIKLKERRMSKAKEQVLREKRNRSLLKKSRSI